MARRSRRAQRAGRSQRAQRAGQAQRARRARRRTARSETPTRRQCGTMQVHFRLLEADPGFRARQTALEHATARRLEAARATWKVVTIPTVVHVVYRTAAENISDAQVRSQIRVLNRDFRRKNPDRSKVPAIWSGLVGDAGVRFTLAKIVRTQTNRTGFDADDSVKSGATGGVNPWPTSKYLNIWVCTLAGGLLGYAQFPGGPSATDGVVILNTAFGTTGTATRPFHLGRTTTHEVGHWLNLRHIWADTPDCSGSDFVADTPNAEGPNFGRPTFPRISCANGPSGDMFMNYMDYVDDDTMFMFTTGQVERMHAALEGARKGFLP
jgi:hypothetical protein